MNIHEDCVTYRCPTHVPSTSLCAIVSPEVLVKKQANRALLALWQAAQYPVVEYVH